MITGDATAGAPCFWCRKPVSHIHDRPSRIHNAAFDQVSYLHNRCLAELVDTAVKAQAANKPAVQVEIGADRFEVIVPRPALQVVR